MSIHGFETVIGLEVHAQLMTKSKLFCGCSTQFGAEPNAQTCPVCLGLPGALPVLNRKAVDFAIRFGLSVGADPTGTSTFARKNYFYPDLPKGYQISQFDAPIVGRGKIRIELENGEAREIGLTRAHLEEDAGQSVHDGMPQSKLKSYVNLNRTGIPLLEIVSEPELRSPEEAFAYLNALKDILTYLEINDGNMEEGSLRCDANVSIRPVGETKLGTRTELKNLNSFNNVRRAIQHEIDRQVTVVTAGGKIEQCTLLWDADAQTTRVMRTKEDSHDYRYFPDPDLPRIFVKPEWVSRENAGMPELPQTKFERFTREYGLPRQDAQLMVSDKLLAAYYETVASVSGNPKSAANWIMSELMRDLKEIEGGIAACPIAAEQLGKMIGLIEDGTISGKIAKEVFAEMFQTRADAASIVERRGLRQIVDTGALEAVVQSILANHPAQVAEYRGGKAKVFGFFVGQAMRETKGKGNPDLLNQLLKKHLDGE